MNPVAWFAENRVAANMLMILIIVGGFIVIPKTQKETFPNVALDAISINAIYPGASAKEVEEAICVRIERAVSGYKEVNSIISNAKEGVCFVQVFNKSGSDINKLTEKISASVGAIANYPRNALRPTVTQQSTPKFVASIAVVGETNHKTLKTLAESVRDDLNDLNLTQVVIANAKNYEISIEVSEAALQEYNLSFAEIAQVIQRNSMKSSGGKVSTGAGSIAVETGGQAKTAEDFRNIVIRATPDGGQVHLGDIANVRDGFQESNKRAYVNGKPAVTLNILLPADQSILDVSNTLYEYMDAPKTSVPEGVEIILVNDLAIYFENRINLLVSNAVSGLILVFIFLTLFLRTQLAFWVSAGIVIAFLGGFIVLFATGQSINMISTFGLLLVLGIVVDDAIIVGEHVNSYQEKDGISGTQAAVKAASDISKPVMFAVATTAMTFVPLFFLPGSNGKLFYSLPVIVIGTLIFSLIECLLILPSHLSSYSEPKTPGPMKAAFTRVLNKLQGVFNDHMTWLSETVYQRILALALNWRYTAMLSFIMVFFLALSLIGGGWIQVRLLSSIEADASIANVSFARGVSVDITAAAVKRIEDEALKLKAQLKQESGKEQILFVRSTVAGQGDHTGQVVLALATADNRELSAEAINDRWREMVGPIKQAASLDYSATFNKPGPQVNIELSSKSPEKLKQAADDLSSLLGDYPAIYGVKSSYKAGSQTVQLKLKPAAYDLGLDMQSLAAQVRQAFYGTEVQSILRNQAEVKVVIRYPQEERSSLWHLENMRIRLADGNHVPLQAIADVFYELSEAEITRVDRRRVVSVSAYIDESIEVPQVVHNSIRSDFLDQLSQTHPGVRWSPSGAQKEVGSLNNFFAAALLVSLLAMYVLMSILFKSYTQPLLVLTAIPFGIVGAMVGHLFMGYELNIWSAAGIIAVSGIVVNDNMVLIFYINECRERGEKMIHAIRSAGTMRFRPIILTSATTFIGLVPLMMETSFEAQFLIPMAISISFGVLFATFVSLLLIPAMYLIFEDIAQRKLIDVGSQIKKNIDQVDADELDDLLFDDEGIVDDRP